MTADHNPFIVKLGGTWRHGSSTQLALEAARARAASMGAMTLMITDPELAMPFDKPEVPRRTAQSGIPPPTMPANSAGETSPSDP